MSAPSTRGQRGGSSTRGGRASSFSSSRGRGSSRGSSAPNRGRGRGGANASTSGAGDGLLQRLRTGTIKRGSENGTATQSGRGRGTSNPPPSTPYPGGRGRGRGYLSQTFNAPKTQPSPSTPASRPSSPAPSNHRDFMNAAYAKFQELKQEREKERAKAIRDGFLADPDKKTSLDKAITPVGTCTEMCPEFERVERIVQNMVDKAEKVRNEETGKDIPSEERMVKRFRRSAAGYDEQLPSDIRTPATLQKTLDYLLDKVIGGEERLASIHKFVWDRTRGIRNDFSIQQVTNVDDVKIAVDCYERIARFHILSLHQLSNPDNLMEGEHFDAHQEREQLNNTLLSLLYYYDDNRQRMDFPNEGEFRAYCIIFELQSQHPDLEDRIQSWPKPLLEDKRVQTALKLYMAAGNTIFEQGPLRPTAAFDIAQSKGGTFWQILSSTAVPYMMACVAEIYFAAVRFAALDALWRSCKSAPAAQQAKSRDWSLAEVTTFLGFDTEAETGDFCAAFDLYFATDEHGDEYLDVTSNSAHSLDQSSIPNRQLFSHTYVEKKRYYRSLTAVINGVPVAEAIRQGLVAPEQEPDNPEVEEEAAGEDDQSMFVAEAKPTTAINSAPVKPSSFGSALNPAASTFKPKFGDGASVFGQPAATSMSTSTSTFGQPTGFGSAGFGSSGFSGGFGTTTSPSSSSFGNPPAGQQPTGLFGFGGFTAPAKELKANTTAAPGPPLSGDSVKTPTFTGFNLSQAVSTSSTTPGASAAVASSSSAIPPIFGPHATLPPASAPAEEPKPKASAATPSFQFTNLSPPAIQTPKTSGSTSQSSDKPQATLPPAPTFTFQPQPSQPSPGPSQAASTASQAKPSFEAPTTEDSSLKPAPSSATAPSTPPFFLPKPPSTSENQIKPPSEGFKFPSVQLPTFKAADQVQPKSNQPHAESSSQTFVPPTVSAQAPPKNTIPARSPTPPAAEPVFSQADRDQLVENVAKVALLRKNGLMQHYLEYTLPDLIRTALNQHRIEVHDAALASVRSRILARKFGYIWRARAWRNILSRRAKNRRQLFAQTMRAEHERKKRTEEELEEIIHATAETKRLQKEVEQARESRQQRSTIQVNNTPGKLAGQKRKSFSGQDAPATVVSQNGMGKSTSSNVGHKRSRTMGTFCEPNTSDRSSLPPVPSFGASSNKPAHHVSIFSAKSTLGRSVSNQDLRQSVSAHKVDTTHTDYFRLKALGVDPDTSIIPVTEETLASRKRRQEEERKAVLAKASRRARHAGSVQSSPPTTASTSPPAPPPVASSPRSEAAATTTPKTASLAPVEEDDFLKQIREARQAMAEQAEWFKEQTVTLQKELEQEKDFGNSRATHNPFEGGSDFPATKTAPATNGFGLASTNGYDYQPGTSLSRTERRIRMTGAHGLATRPLRSSSEYIPVAMSKRSAMRYNSGGLAGQSQSRISGQQASFDTTSPGRKRHHYDDEDEEGIDPQLGNETYENQNVAYGGSTYHHALKRPRSDTGPRESHRYDGDAHHDNDTDGASYYHQQQQQHRKSRNPYELLQSYSTEGDEEDEEDGEDEDAESRHQEYGSQAPQRYDQEEAEPHSSTAINQYPSQQYPAQAQGYPYPPHPSQGNVGSHDQGEEEEEDELEEEEELEEDLEEEYDYGEYYEDEDVEREGEEEDDLVEDDSAEYASDDDLDDLDDDADLDTGNGSGTTPSTNPPHMLSRATSSGPGASMDDALVLSDSD